MITGDASYIKKINRSIILREIVKEGVNWEQILGKCNL